MRRAEAIFAAILVVVILGTSFISLVAANGSGNNSYILKPEAREELIALVNEAKDFVLAEGKDKAFVDLQRSQGKVSKWRTLHKYHITSMELFWHNRTSLKR